MKRKPVGQTSTANARAKWFIKEMTRYQKKEKGKYKDMANEFYLSDSRAKLQSIQNLQF